MGALAVILNPSSGRGRAAAQQETLQRALVAAGLDARFFLTTGPGHATELALEAKRAGFATVAAAGGDGTVSEVVNGLMAATEDGMPVGTLALLPFGSGNDFATHLGVPGALAGAVDVIAAGQVRRIDVGHATVIEGGATVTRYFNNGMGVGLEAAVTLASYEFHRLQGLPLYLAAALKTLPRFRAIPLALTAVCADGSTWTRQAPMLMLTLGNSPRSGGGFYLTPGAQVDDGVLDVLVAADVAVWRRFVLLPQAMRGRHEGDRAVTMLRVRALACDASAGAPVQLDGEVIARAATRVEVSVLPASLGVIVPVLADGLPSSNRR
jgi:diacylglycerol kinase (ATP)